MANYAIVDVGSNTVRLVVYQISDDTKSQYVRADFSTIVNDKIMAGLAAYVEDGVFSEAGVRKATSTIKAHLRHAAYFDCKQTSIFATAVIRNALNCNEAVQAIELATGVPIDVISGPDEARLGFLGVKSEVDVRDGVMIDIGGGSTELTVVENGIPGACTSIAQGSLSSFSSMVKFITPSPTELANIRNSFETRLASSVDPAIYSAQRLFGVGGSVRAAAKMLAAMDNAPTRPNLLTRLDVERILQLCENDLATYAHTALRAAPERVHTLAPGCAILAQTMETLGAAEVAVCRCGIREGYLIERVLKATVGAPQPLEQPAPRN